MAGISPSPLDLASARGPPPPPPPPWMQGPATQNGSGPASALQPSLSTPPPPHRPVLGSSPAITPPSGYAAIQFRSVGSLPPQPSPAFVPSSAPQFRPVAPSPSVSPNLSIQPPNMLGMGSPMQPQTMQFPQGVLPSQGISFNPPQRPLPGPIQVPQVNFLPLGAVRVTPPPSFTYATQNFGVRPATVPAAAAPLQVHPPPSMMQPWNMAPSGPLQTGQTGQQNSLTVNSILDQTGSDWQEHSAPDGRRYYYNKITKQSSWEKPTELMTPVERADASTVWKEFTAADGRKYYYNKLTKQSRWSIPEEMKLAREQVHKAANPPSAEVSNVSPSPKTSALPVTVTTAATSALSTPSSPTVGSSIAAEAALNATTKISIVGEDALTTTAIEPTQPEGAPETAIGCSQSEGGPTSREQPDSPATSAEKEAKKIENEEIDMKSGRQQICESDSGDLKESPSQDIEEAKKATPSAGHVNVTPLNEDKPLVAEGATVYSNKVEAKNAFKELLESVHVASDWTWEQAMRVIINDKRYGALKTLGERKQTFNEFLAHRKKQEVEEKRARQKKAREEFIIMLQESRSLSSKMRWSKVASILAEDPRFRAVEKDREREELFEDYLIELETKEKERAREDRKKNIVEYRKFLESCDFIKASTQWRKVADRLEEDERCTRLAKADRLDVFQEYIRDLEKAMEEEIKKEKEQQRRRERTNRDDFRKLLEEHRISGLLTVRVAWWDYVAMVKDHSVYIAVCSNTSGTTPKELFEDVADDMIKQYSEDKGRIKDFMKTRKINLTSDWTLEEFKAAILNAGVLGSISEQTLKFVFEDLLERVKEKEEKEAKLKKRAADDFNELLHTDKSITVSSVWEDCKGLLENTPAFRIVGDEILCKTLFDEYVLHLQQKAKEKEKKREDEKERREKDKDKEKGKEKERKDKEREKEKPVKRDRESQIEASFDNDKSEKEQRKKDRHGEKGKHRDKKHKRHHQSKSNHDMTTAKDESKKSHKHSSDKKKSSRKHGDDQASDGEHKHKKHRRDRDQENGKIAVLEDGELGADGDHL